MRLPTSIPARRTAAGTVIAAGVLVGGLVGAAPVSAATATPAAAAHPATASQRHATAKEHKATKVMNHKLRKLRGCESGDRYHINTGNGYYGAYQFAASTWHSLGYHGLPSRAKAKTQNAAARKLHASQGWHPWPVCSKKEHLSS